MSIETEGTVVETGGVLPEMDPNRDTQVSITIGEERLQLHVQAMMTMRTAWDRLVFPYSGSLES